MKVYVADFNNVLLGLRDKVDTTINPHEADCFIVWQDVRGYMKELAEMNRDYFHKPFIVVQHGRGATRDYLEPNNFKLIADRICVWGQKEYDRMEKAGYGKQCVVTGSPLIHYLQGKTHETYKEKFVIFNPVITTHEEVENLEVWYELKKIELTYMQETLRKYRIPLKRAWHSWLVDETCATDNKIPQALLKRDFQPVAKITDIHDQNLYVGTNVLTYPCNVQHLPTCVKVLQNADCLVGMEEGTLQLMASYLDVPTVIVNGFKYECYGGVENYDRMETIQTPATAFTDLSTLRETIEYEMTNKHLRQDARRRVVQEEFLPESDMNPIERILDTASELCGQNVRKQEVLNGNS